MENVEQQVPELVVLPLQLMNDLMSYLGTKPHTEVEPYILAIRKECRVVPREDQQTFDPPKPPISSKKVALRKVGK